MTYLDMLTVLDIFNRLTTSIPFITIVILIIFDFFVGISKAFYLKSFSSDYGIKGVIRSLVIVGLIFIVGFFSLLSNQDYIITTFIIFFILEYLLSIVENLELLNIPLPDFLRDLIENYGTMNKKKMKEQILSNRKRDDKNV